MQCEKLENGCQLLITAITKDEQKVIDAIWTIYEANRATIPTATVKTSKPDATESVIAGCRNSTD